MIIEIIECGGIYAYKLDNQFLYIGKTKNSFEKRNQEHYTNNKPTDFEKILKENKNITLYILYDCHACPLTAEQLDYLETVFINLFNPIYNIQKKNINISYNNINMNNSQFKNFSKSETLIYQIIQQNYKSGDKFTKKDIQQYLSIKMSETTLRRALQYFINLNILQLFYANGSNENIYLVT